MQLVRFLLLKHKAWFLKLLSFLGWISLLDNQSYTFLLQLLITHIVKVNSICFGLFLLIYILYPINFFFKLLFSLCNLLSIFYLFLLFLLLLDNKKTLTNLDRKVTIPFVLENRLKDDGSNIIDMCQKLQSGQKAHEFIVIGIVIPTQYW